ncbi:polyadenylate-binding protein-interacting protein 2-like [Pungitius pungitius]|uniref:polyadenylate-binding protein-interacting protein 2-like n=1 Tax=Pungitius pungitius TaxID=134920 RepID=UPI00188752F3|nr:polyadenylate-binding protein-interacting protein 2-like [Pungitius pungitius]XP_037318281.1 polyadenylate-binding protein-interacting protein 2-like [Pungitius pungitius]
MRDPRLSSETMTIDTELVLNRVAEDDPFAEYMWMENEEEFNRQVEEELWEEEFMERCFQEMLEEEEQWEWFIPSRDLPQLQELVMKSSLNPNAKEFTPGIQKHVM